uniref:Uncharacterized protein n=1 Tax=Rhizophora mucronata TaxID=61149 RepID=A0A2P2MAD4_RHIMU
MTFLLFHNFAEPALSIPVLLFEGSGTPKDKTEMLPNPDENCPDNIVSFFHLCFQTKLCKFTCDVIPNKKRNHNLYIEGFDYWSMC